ncbi:MAG: hypothetical protein KF687_13860 [Cyclobacteriaceae bacterium]|nr:hypothetical protein [Cyclobacteriaceae bacterium]
MLVRHFSKKHLILSITPLFFILNIGFSQNQLDLVKYDSVVTAHGDNGIYIIHAKYGYIDLYDSPAGILTKTIIGKEPLQIIKEELTNPINRRGWIKVRRIFGVEEGYIHTNYAEIDPKISSIINDLFQQLQKQKFEQRKSELIRKYGEKNALRLMKGEIWIGMTMEQAIDGVGEPYSITETISKNGTQHQLRYERRILYFENGVLAIIQNLY